MRRFVDHDPFSGITTWTEFDGLTKKTSIYTTYEHAQTDAVLDYNHRMANHNPSGWDAGKEWRLVGLIPNSVIHELMVNHGLDVLRREHWPEIRKKIINNSDYRKLRASHWTV